LLVRNSNIGFLIVADAGAAQSNPFYGAREALNLNKVALREGFIKKDDE